METVNSQRRVQTMFCFKKTFVIVDMMGFSVLFIGKESPVTALCYMFCALRFYCNIACFSFYNNSTLKIIIIVHFLTASHKVNIRQKNKI